MKECATKNDIDTAILKHEKEAGVRQKANIKEEQALRHETTQRYAKDLYSYDEKVDKLKERVVQNEKELSLSKKAHDYMKDKIDSTNETVKELSIDIKAGFQKMEDAMANNDSKYATKEQHSTLVKVLTGMGLTIFTALASYVWSQFTNLLDK